MTEEIEMGKLPVEDCEIDYSPVLPSAKSSEEKQESPPETFQCLSEELWKPEPTPEELLRKREIVSMIRSYKLRFAAHVEDLDTKNYSSRSVHELEILLSDIQFQVESRQGDKMIRNSFVNSMFWAESAGDLVGLKLQGLAENVAASEAVLECVDEVSLKYKPRLQDPLARLGLEMITLCARLDAHNREKEEKLGKLQPTSPLSEEKLSEKKRKDGKLREGL